MSDQADPLAGLWTATEAPARDLHFELALEERLARRRLALDAARVVGVGAAVSLCVAALWPALSPAVQALGTAFSAGGPVIAVVLMVTVLGLWRASPLSEPRR